MSDIVPSLADYILQRKRTNIKITDSVCYELSGAIGVRVIYRKYRGKKNVPYFDVSRDDGVDVQVSLDAIIAGLVYCNDNFWHKSGLVTNETLFREARMDLMHSYDWTDTHKKLLINLNMDGLTFIQTMDLFEHAYDQLYLIEADKFPDHPLKVLRFASWKERLVQHYFSRTKYLLDSLLDFKFVNHATKSDENTAYMVSVTYYNILQSSIPFARLTSAQLEDIFYPEDYVDSEAKSIANLCAVPLTVNILLWLTQHVDVDFEPNNLPDIKDVKRYDASWFTKGVWPFEARGDIKIPFLLCDEYGFRVKMSMDDTPRSTISVLWRLLASDGVKSFISTSQSKKFLNKESLQHHWTYILDIFATEKFQQIWIKPLVETNLIDEVIHHFRIADVAEAKTLANACNLDIYDFTQRILMDNIGRDVQLHICEAMNLNDETLIYSWRVPTLEDARDYQRRHAKSYTSDEDVILYAFLNEMCNMNKGGFTLYKYIKYSPIVDATRSLDALMAHLDSWRPLPRILFILLVKSTLAKVPEAVDANVRRAILGIEDAIRMYMRQESTNEKLTLPSDVLGERLWNRVVGVRVSDIGQEEDETFKCTIRGSDDTLHRLPLSTLLAAVVSDKPIPAIYIVNAEKYERFLELKREILDPKLEEFPHLEFNDLIKHTSGQCWTTSYNIYRLDPTRAEYPFTYPDEMIPVPSVEHPTNNIEYFRSDSWIQEATLLRLFMLESDVNADDTASYCQQIRSEILNSEQLTSFPFKCKNEIWFGQTCLAYLLALQYRPSFPPDDVTCAAFCQTSELSFPQVFVIQLSPNGAQGFHIKQVHEDGTQKWIKRCRAWISLIKNPAGFFDKTNLHLDNKLFADKFKIFFQEWISKTFIENKRQSSTFELLDELYQQHPYINSDIIHLRSPESLDLKRILEDERNKNTLVQWISIMRMYLDENLGKEIAIPYCLTERNEHIRMWQVPAVSEDAWYDFLNDICERNILNFTLFDHLRTLKDPTRFKKRLIRALPLNTEGDWSAFRLTPFDILGLVTHTRYQLNITHVVAFNRIVDCIVALAVRDERINDNDNINYRKSLFYGSSSDIDKPAIVQYKEGSIFVDDKKSHIGTDDECVPYGTMQLAILLMSPSSVLPAATTTQIPFMTAVQFAEAKKRFSNCEFLLKQYERITPDLARAWTKVSDGNLMAYEQLSPSDKNFSSFEALVKLAISLFSGNKVTRLRHLDPTAQYTLPIDHLDISNTTIPLNFPIKLGLGEAWWNDPSNYSDEEYMLNRNGNQAILFALSKCSNASIQYVASLIPKLASCETEPPIYTETSVRRQFLSPPGPILLIEMIIAASKLYDYEMATIQWQSDEVTNQLVDLGGLISEVDGLEDLVVSADSNTTVFRLLYQMRKNKAIIRLFGDKWLYVNKFDDQYNRYGLLTSDGDQLSFGVSYTQTFFEIMKGNFGRVIPNNELITNKVRQQLARDKSIRFVTTGKFEAGIKVASMIPQLTRVERDHRFLRYRDFDQITNRLLRSYINDIDSILQAALTGMEYPLTIGNMFKITVPTEKELPRNTIQLIAKVRDQQQYNNGRIRIERQNNNDIPFDYYYNDYEIILDYFLKLRQLETPVPTVDDFGDVLFAFVSMLFRAWHTDGKEMEELLASANDLGGNSVVRKFFSKYDILDSDGLKAILHVKNNITKPIIVNVTNSKAISTYGIPHHFVRMTSFPPDFAWLTIEMGLPRRLAEQCVARWSTERHPWLALQLDSKAQQLSTWSGLLAMARDHFSREWLWNSVPQTVEDLLQIHSESFNDVNQLLQRGIIPPGRWIPNWIALVPNRDQAIQNPLTLLQAYQGCDHGIKQLESILQTEIVRTNTNSIIPSLKNIYSQLLENLPQWNRPVWSQYWYDLYFSTRDLPRLPSDEESRIRRNLYNIPIETMNRSGGILNVGVAIVCLGLLVYIMGRRNNREVATLSPPPTKKRRRN